MFTASHKGMILAAIADALRPAGFRKNGSKFTRNLGDVIHLISLQSSTSSTAASLQATANLAVWVPALADNEGPPDMWSSHWRERIGQLMPDRSDRWWTVTNEKEAAVAASEIREAIQMYVLPTFAALATSAALVQLWKSGVSPGLTERQAQRYLQRLHESSRTG